MSIPTLDDDLSRQMEPKAPRPSDRLRALKAGSEKGLRTFAAIAPTAPMVNAEGFKALLGELMECNPEVLFWEPVNARGTNAIRMMNAGISWVESVSSRKLWAENFARQYADLQKAAESLGILDKIHPWLDPELKKEGVLVKEVEKWLSRPTVEIWQ